MTDVHGDLMDVAGFRDDGEANIRSTVGRPASNDTAFVTGAWHKFPVVAGVVSMTDLDPGPAELFVRMGDWSQLWTVTVPDEVEPISFTTLLDAYVEYDPAVVAQAQAARDAAINAADQSRDYRDGSRDARDGAVAAYAALTDDIENAADAVRTHVAGDADRAELARAGAEAAQAGAESAEASAEGHASAANSSRSAASGHAASASTKAGEAAVSADAAALSESAADQSSQDADAARIAAEAAQAGAETAESNAAASASAASGHAGDADSARGGAESARDDANYARTQALNAQAAAETARDDAGVSEANAAGSAAAALAEANRAQSAADDFGLSAGTVTTGSPSSSAQVTVTGSGPAYTLNFVIPRGQQGGVGPKGDGLKIDFTPATYAALPTGLNSTTDVGKVAWVVSNNRIYVWSGTAWPDEADGLMLTGAKGDDGWSAYEVAISNGFVGSESEWLASLKGSRGEDGDDGASAYALAVADGFVGSLSEWLASLHGADGATSWNDLDDKPATFPPIIGETSSTAKAGDWMPGWSDVKNKPSTFPPTIGSGGTQAVAGNDPRLTNARPPTAHTHTMAQVDGLDTALAALDTPEPLDVNYWVFGAEADRETGLGDNPLGIRLQRAVVIESFHPRCVTAGGGNLTIELRKNGAAVAGSSHTIAAGSQVTGTTKTGVSAEFAAGDVLTVAVTAAAGSAGKGLVVDMKGYVA